MKPNQFKVAMTIIYVALNVINARLLTLLSMSGAFFLFCWSAQSPEPLRLASAVLFSVICFLPTFALHRKEQTHESNDLDAGSPAE